MDTEKTFKTRFNGRMIECKALTSGQITVVEMLSDIHDVDKDVDPEGFEAMQERARTGLGRLFRVVESRVGKAEWALIDEGMVTGTVNNPDIMALITKMIEGTAKLAAADQDKPVMMSGPTE